MRRAPVLAFVALLAAGCGEATERATTPQLVVATTGGLELEPEVVSSFEEGRDVVVVVANEPDPARALDDLAASPDDPAADLVIGLPDAVVLDRAETEFATIAPEGVARLPADVRDGAPPGTVPLTIRDLCVLWDRAALAERELPEPRGFGDLASEALAGQLVVPDPATTLEGRLLLDAMRQRLPEGQAPAWLDVAATLQRNGTEVAPSWRSGFDTAFVSPARPDGPALVWAAAAMPAVVLAFREEGPSTATLAVDASTCIRSTGLAAIPATSRNQDLAEEFVAHLLTPEVQVTLLDSGGALPARRDVPLPPVWQRFAVRPSGVATPTGRAPDEPPLASVWMALLDPAPADDQG